MRGFATKDDDDFDPPKRRGRPRKRVNLGTEDSDIPSEGHAMTRELFKVNAEDQSSYLEEGEYIDYDEGAHRVNPTSDIYLS